MDRIDIGTVLNKFNDTTDIHSGAVKTFGLRYINDRGEKREHICRKNIKSPKQAKSGSEERGKEMYNLKYNGVMLIKAQGEDHPRTIKTCMIYSFKDFQSSTWLNVFH
jgi:hypothetical protein